MRKDAQARQPTHPVRSCVEPLGHGITSAAWNRCRAHRQLPGLTHWLRSVPAGERTHALIHVLGAIVFAILGSALVISTSIHRPPALSAAVVVFVCVLVVFYALSALYDAGGVVSRGRLRRAPEHGALYVLAAGTATPFVVDLGGTWGVIALLCTWCLAIAAVLSGRPAVPAYRWRRPALHVASGLLVLVFAYPASRHFDSGTLAWLLAGGCAYAAGSCVRLLSRRPFMQTLWHGLLALGSALHLIAVASITTASAG